MRWKNGAAPATRWRNSPSFRPKKSSSDVHTAILLEARMRIRGLGLVLVGIAMASVSLAAHHSFAMFEMDKDVEYQGVVSEWKWQNPHVHFTMDVKPGPGVDPGQVGRW